MNPDSCHDRKTLERRAERRELIATSCGYLVFVGLLIEYGDEIIDCYLNAHAPSRQLLGGILVTAGVFGEVLFARLALKTSRTLTERADSEVAQANEQIERLRKENNETALLLSNRSVGNTLELEKAMTAFAGTSYMFEVFAEDFDSANLHKSLEGILNRAGWVSSSPAARRYTIGPGVAVVTHADGRENRGPNAPAALALADWLDANNVSVLTMVAQTTYPLVSGSIVIAVGPKPATLAAMRDFKESYNLRRSQPAMPAE